MTIRPAEERPRDKPVIDLSGPLGNAWALRAEAEQLCKQLSLNFNKIETEMMAGDYENLLTVFDKHFGLYVDLQR